MTAQATAEETGAPTMAVGGRRRNLFLVANNLEEMGGLQRVAHNLAATFAAAGHNVELIGIMPHPSALSYAPGDTYRTTVLYGQPAPPTWRPRTLRDRLDLRSRRREHHRRRLRRAAVDRLSERFRSVPDGIVICTQAFAMDWVHEADTSHLRVITQSHESYEASRGLTPASRGSARYTRMRRTYRDVDLFLLLTQHDADMFEREGFNNVGVLHNPLTMYPDRRSDLSAKTVINVGRYHEQKNQRALIDAFALVWRRHPDWRLQLVGEGPLQSALREQVDALGLGAAVSVGGPTAEVQARLLASSIFAMSSDFEGLPLVLAEAMACGVPCVSFDCAPGIREIIADGADGLVVPPRDTAALAGAICRLIEDADLRQRMGAAARWNIRRFAPVEILRQWHEVFDLVER